MIPMIPETINICGVPHTINLCEDVFDVDRHFGQIDYAKAEIKINRDMPITMQMQALIHEWVHGALVMIGRNDETQDEQLVQGLAMAINQTFCLKSEG